MTPVLNFFSWISIVLVLDVTSVHAAVVSMLVSVTEGESVTLHTGVIKQQHEDIKWYFNYIRIAQLNGDFSDMCTDVQCNEGTERFRDRLKLDRKTGSLTIININTADSGEYQLVVNGNSGKIFNVTVHDDPDAHRYQIKENQGESVTLDPGMRRERNVGIKYFFYDIFIAEITVNQSQSCADVQCKERFTDRLNLDNGTASLTVTKTKITDSGNYTLEIFIWSDDRFSIIREKRFNLTITSPPPSHLSGGAVAGIVVLVVVVAAAAAAAAAAVGGVIYYLCYRKKEAPAQNEDAAAENML
ncbi:uncharacterized protein LOC130216160 [Danio aesculapii]|uniref:uncharacterized protein LOC130216160 n=1 Tax=Danio aesculapii TaxID=1142201 RepID=UPI0024BFE351|nr:uncharacterized protein LOC130216160 [Danio aesculapii]